MQVRFGSLTESIQYIKDGKLRALAVTTAIALEVLPDVQRRASSAWLRRERLDWRRAPKTRPRDIEKLNREINAGLADPKLKARFTDQGPAAFVGSPADFGKFIVDETDKWAKVVRTANIKPD